MAGTAHGPFIPALPVEAPENTGVRESPRYLDYPVGGPLCPGCHPERYDENGVRPEFAHLEAAYHETGAS